MEKRESAAEVAYRTDGARESSSPFSGESLLHLHKLIFSGSPLFEVLAYVARSVEAQAEGTACTIWLPDEDTQELYCAAAPSLPGFTDEVGDRKSVV